MIKENLETGMVVETKNGNKYVVILSNYLGDAAVCRDNHINLASYNEELKYKNDGMAHWDIVKVFTLPGGGTNQEQWMLREANEHKLIVKSTEVFWSREREMTVAEIEKALGLTNLKIVK